MIYFPSNRQQRIKGTAIFQKRVRAPSYVMARSNGNFDKVFGHTVVVKDPTIETLEEMSERYERATGTFFGHKGIVSLKPLVQEWKTRKYRRYGLNV